MFNYFTVLSVTIGMMQTEYTVGEVDGYQLVCFGVLSGDIDNREIVFTYSTSSGTAGGARAYFLKLFHLYLVY